MKSYNKKDYDAQWGSGTGAIILAGRPKLANDFAKELKMDENHGLLVSFNYSKVVDCKTNKVLFNETMTVEEGQAVLEHMKKFKVKPMIDKDDYMYVNDVYDCYIDNGGKPLL